MVYVREIYHVDLNLYCILIIGMLRKVKYRKGLELCLLKN